jgi:excisionase family DNA binding protein
MKVVDIRRRLGQRLGEAAMEKDPDSLALALDYCRAILLALSPLPDDQDVELSELTVSTATAARILSLHVEYVRELIRRGVLPGTKHNNEYEVKLSDVMDFMSSSRYRAGGEPSALARAAMLRFGPVWHLPRIDLRPGQEPGLTP